jgi:uncharacterized membrane protein YhaH (DUF805 family)
MTLPERVDRRAFWTWVIPLGIAHAGLSTLAAAGVNAMGALDTVAVIWLAALVAARFRDIGWRGWIGASFMIATMVAAPLAFIAYAIASKFPPAQFMEAMNEVGLIVGIANLVLLVVSGSVRGSGAVDPIPAGAVVDALQPPAEARSPSAAQDAHREPSVLAMTAGIMLVTLVVVVAVVGIAIALLAPRPYAASAPSAPSAGQLPGVQPIREPTPPVQNWTLEPASPTGPRPGVQAQPRVQNWTLESERNGRSR